MSVILKILNSIDFSIDSILERLKFSSIELSFDNRIYWIYPQDTHLDDFPIDGNERLINKQIIYGINDNIIFILKNGSSVDV